MQLYHKYQQAVRFANFAKLWDLEPEQLARLCQLAHRAFSAAERECNGTGQADTARARFEHEATAAGFATQWNGLAPTLRKNGADVFLPTI